MLSSSFPLESSSPGTIHAVTSTEGRRGDQSRRSCILSFRRMDRATSSLRPWPPFLSIADWGRAETGPSQTSLHKVRHEPQQSVAMKRTQQRTPARKAGVFVLSKIVEESMRCGQSSGAQNRPAPAGRCQRAPKFPALESLLSLCRSVLWDSGNRPCGCRIRIRRRRPRCVCVSSGRVGTDIRFCLQFPVLANLVHAATHPGSVRYPVADRWASR